MSKFNIVNYAKQENTKMRKGKKIFGTPYSTLEHTIIHLKFYNKFPSLILKEHIKQEINAQLERKNA